ncbi:MAG: alpha/beta hydrolase [Pseudoxanthomonas spadix]|nr:MAG: alpha/beta hydrolase [Pseudoxanthomonas spadix]
MTHTLATDTLDIGYACGGPEDGSPVLLLHGWPDDVLGWAQVAPALEAAGYRWVAPWLRGFGPTRFRSADTLRDGTGVALAQDAIDLADALGWDRFAVVGHDWGGRAAYVLAALWPERVAAIASLAIGYAPRGRFQIPASFEQSQRWWYQWFMATDGGAAAVAADPIGFARLQWQDWSPPGWYDEAAFARTAESFRNPDWVAVTLHGYRSRWRSEPLDPRYAAARQRLAAVETLRVPTLMIQGEDDRCDPPAESAHDARFFTGGYRRIVLPGVGHFPAREAPVDVAHALVQHLGDLKRSW